MQFRARLQTRVFIEAASRATPLAARSKGSSMASRAGSGRAAKAIIGSTVGVLALRARSRRRPPC
jgi:hypothetical protein